MATTTRDLAVDVNVNGTNYPAGKDVEIKPEHVEAVDQLHAGYAEQVAWANTHHGAVPVSADPSAATAQTPTRPLGAEHLRIEVSSDPEVADTEPVVVTDPGTEENK